jgi:UDP-glucose 4-epimerase
VEHHNTEHPHLHIVIRGIRSDGGPLRLSRDATDGLGRTYEPHKIRICALTPRRHVIIFRQLRSFLNEASIPTYMTTGMTGSRGFIGSYLSTFLLRRQCGTLRLLSRNSAGPLGPSGAMVVHGDLLSRSDCKRFAEDLKLIYYLAHKNSPVDSDSDLPGDALANMVALLNLLQVIRYLGTKPHIVYFSSGGAIYAPKDDRIPFRETDPCGSLSSYGIQKLAAEQYLRLAAHKGYLTATVLRVGNAYGTLLSQFRMQGLIGVAVNCVMLGKSVRIFGNPNNVRDYVHLEDISEIAVRAALPRQPFTIVNVGNGVGHSVLDVLHLMEEELGRPIEIHSDPTCGNWLTDWVVLDNAKAREEFGWSPAIDLRSGIRRMLDGWQIESQFDEPTLRKRAIAAHGAK